MEDIIVSTYGVGPTYRKRVIHNIKKAINTGYDKIMPYIILTDNPEDFDELRLETDLVIDVLNVHTEREKYAPWSKDYEYISPHLDEENYGEDYRVNSLEKGNHFSNAVHRFTLPKIAELGYNRFLWCECDTDIRYDKIITGELTEEEFWDVCYSMPVNTVKGCDYEEWGLRIDRPWENNNIIMGNILRFVMTERHPEYSNITKNSQNYPFFLRQKHVQTEGIRLYNLKSSKLVMEYFELWNEIMEITFKTKDFREQLLIGGGYIYIDNTPISVVNNLLEISMHNLPKSWHNVNIYVADRYALPRGIGYHVPGVGDLSPQIAKNVKEFYEINETLITYLRTTGQWDE